MNRVFRSVSTCVLAASLAASACVSLGQTPAQMEYERQQREYWRQQEQQRQEQQRQQQLMQENARRQQEESSRINAPQGQGSAGAASPSAQGRGGSQAAADQLSAARARWEKQPPLPPDKNPLLGTWTRPAASRPNPSDPFAGLMALAKGGMCEVLFGGGIFEFRADRLVGKDERTPEQELDRVEYRGDAKHVVVLPKTTLKLIEFDFEGPDRINWKAANCVLVRFGNQPARAAASAGTAAGAPATRVPAATSGAAAQPGSVPANGAGGKLALSVAALAPGYNIAGRKLWVLKEDAQVALIKGGVASTPNASVLQNWIRACTSRTPLCEKGAGALKPYSIGVATTDATGHALTPQLPAGRYWVLADAKVANKHVMWNQPVDVKGGDKSITLGARNAMPVD